MQLDEVSHGWRKIPLFLMRALGHLFRDLGETSFAQPSERLKAATRIGAPYWSVSRAQSKEARSMARMNPKGSNESRHWSNSTSGGKFDMQLISRHGHLAVGTQCRRVVKKTLATIYKRRTSRAGLSTQAAVAQSQRSPLLGLWRYMSSRENCRRRLVRE